MNFTRTFYKGKFVDGNCFPWNNPQIIICYLSIIQLEKLSVCEDWSSS